MRIEYFAGLFDGEGCVFITKRKLARMVNVSYVLGIQVCMTNETVIERLQSRLGGKYWCIKWHERKNNRPAYMWRASAQRAADILSRALDHLIVKRAEAALAIEFQQNMDAYRNKLRAMPAEEQKAVYAYRDQCYRMLQAMKRMSGALDGMVANSGDIRCPVSDDAEGQSRAKQTALRAVGRV